MCTHIHMFHASSMFRYHDQWSAGVHFKCHYSVLVVACPWGRLWRLKGILTRGNNALPHSHRHIGTQLQLHCPLLATRALSFTPSPLPEPPKPPPQGYPPGSYDRIWKHWLFLCNHDNIRILSDKISAEQQRLCLRFAHFAHCISPLSTDILKSQPQSSDPVYFCFFSVVLQPSSPNSSLYSEMCSRIKVDSSVLLWVSWQTQTNGSLYHTAKKHFEEP